MPSDFVRIETEDGVIFVRPRDVLGVHERRHEGRRMGTSLNVNWCPNAILTRDDADTVIGALAASTDNRLPRPNPTTYEIVAQAGLHVCELCGFVTTSKSHLALHRHEHAENCA